MTDQVAFGGGCHWCTEAVFKSLKGVVKVQQGYISSSPPNDSFSEGVIVTFTPAHISLSQLIKVHLHTHKATSNHSFRDTYRSAMYWYRSEQEHAFAKAKKELQHSFLKPIITAALPFVDFKPSRESIRDYYSKNPKAPFCTRYIEPKLKILEEKFATIINESP